MNLARILPAALILLAASQHAQAELGRSAPPSQATPALSTNYRLKLAAKSGDKALGEISLLTCAPAIDASGFLDKPADEALPATTLTLRGKIEEQEGGALLMTYTFGVSTPEVSRTMPFAGAAAKRPEPEAKTGESKAGDARAAAEARPEPRGPFTSVISYRDHFSTGALRMKPGSTYELLTMAGVVYSLTLSPEPQK